MYCGGRINVWPGAGWASPLPGADSYAAASTFLPKAPVTTVSVTRARNMSLSARRSNASLRAASTTCRWYVRLSFFASM